MKSSKSKTAVERMKLIQEVGTVIAPPWNARRLFQGDNEIHLISGDQISLGEDFLSIPDARSGIEWYVEQLGGTVKWQT
jgi:hypothetical protein